MDKIKLPVTVRINDIIDADELIICWSGANWEVVGNEIAVALNAPARLKVERDNYRTVLENHGATFRKDGKVLTMPFYPSDESAELAALRAKLAVAEDALEKAEMLLVSHTIQDNKHLMGAFGVQDVNATVQWIQNALTAIRGEGGSDE